MSPYQAWWKREKMLPGGQLPEKLQKLLDHEDPAFIDEIFLYAFSLYEDRIYQNRKEEKLSYEWLWNLSLHPSPLAKKALVQLLSRFGVEEYYEMMSRNDYSFYIPWYFVNNRNGLIPFENKNPFFDGTLHIVKAMYKRAEEKQDEDLWAVLAYRFDVGRYHNYSKKTRHYLRRRAWRYLRRLGEKGSSDYVSLATKVLLHYDDLDGRWKRFGNRYHPVRSFTHLWVFNHLLYHNSKRFSYPSSQYWQDKGLESYPERLPEEREEAFPELWDQHPEKLFKLLMEAKATPVLQFASRALRLGNPHYVSQQTLMQLLQANHSVQRAFATRSLLERMETDQPDFELLLSLLLSDYPDIRLETREFIARQKEHWTLDQLRRLIKESCEQLERDDKVRDYIAAELVSLFQGPLQTAIKQLATIELAKQFLTSPLSSFQLFSKHILSILDGDQTSLTGEDLLPFLTHSHSAIRETAQKQLENHFHHLLGDGKWIIAYIQAADEESYSFIFHLLQQQREQLRPLLPQLSKELISTLFQADCSESMQTFIVEQLFQKLFFAELLQTPISTVLRLLEHKNTSVQAFAGQLLDQLQLDPRQFSFEQFISMAHHRVAAVRALARRMIMEVRDRITVDWIVNLMETDWDDTREWMMDYVRSLPSSAITPAFIYGLLDTARLDIQTFAKQLVEQHATALDLKELMLRGSEHPDLAVQEYVLTLAEQVEWDPETLQKMELFFRVVLLRVHKGRKAKQKALSLLLKLGEQKRAYAQIVVPILADVVRNLGVKDFETILAALTRIQLQFPECTTPIEIA